jgi:deazaflavin-dependent oxidoreductase (nitroreductase family)
MAKSYQVNGQVKFINRMMRYLIRINIAPKGYHMLTVRGRKTGRTYSIPVTLIEHPEALWLVSPYGEVNWVKNARSAGEVLLSRGGKDETYKIVPAMPVDAAPILKEYIGKEGIVRPYFDVTPESSLEEFAKEAPRHPVFRLERSV